jgi:transcriptional regulator with XRE-family HTH domain
VGEQVSVWKVVGVVSSGDAAKAHPVLSVFAEEMRLARARHCLSQDQLGDKIGYSGSLVSMIEACRRIPSLDFARRCDEATGTGGILARLQVLVAGEVYPSWFRPFAQYEAEATSLRWCESLLVPGLLQTEDYARALLSTRVGTPEEHIEQQVAARIERQAVLDRENPPLLWVLIDEGVLHRPVGGQEVMRHQIEHLTEMAERPSVVVQVISADIGAHDGVNGAFIIADFADAPSIAYLETALTGMVIERRDQVDAVRVAYDGLRTQALPRAASARLLREAGKTWTI